MPVLYKFKYFKVIFFLNARINASENLRRIVQNLRLKFSILNFFELDNILLKESQFLFLNKESSKLTEVNVG